MDITFFCGPSHESFSPKSAEEGRGGSEEMVIGLARALAQIGHTVTVYNRCSADEGVYDGVKYINYEEAENIKTDILIVWRSPELLFRYKLDKLKCKKYLWLHDTVFQIDVIPYLFLFDKILVLSGWHKEYYTKVTAPQFHDRFVITRNAIDYADFEQKVTRDPHTMVYGSLYNRGLIQLLTLWPKVKMAVPDAKLRIFYGWQTLEKIMPLEEFNEFKEMVEHLMDQEGVTHLGRISHKQVAQEMLGAGVWAYPCNFNEVSCITAAKAQIGGAVPVVLPQAAVNETVKYGFKILRGDTMEQVLNRYANGLIKVLQNVKGQEAMRKAMKNYPDWSFSGLAEEWTELFKKTK